MSSSFRSATFTERKPPPIGVVIGPLSATPVRRIASRTSSGSGFPPCLSFTSAPASRTSQSNSTPVASSTRRVASVSSGPVPSPGMSVTWCRTARHFTRASERVRRGRVRAVNEFRPGLEGVVAFETQIAEPDKEGGSLRYRGVDIEELVGSVPYEQVWGLLVDDSFEPGMPDPEPFTLEGGTGNAPSDLQAATARMSAEWGLKKLVDIDDEQVREDLARLSATMMSIVAQSARVADRRGDVGSDDAVAEGESAAEKFLLRWRGEADPRHVKAIDTYWICTAEHGLNASTFTARIVASTGADCGAALSSAVGALSGPLHGGAPAYVKPMIEEVAAMGDPERWVREALESGKRIMGFGHRIYRAEDPRSRILKRTAKELGSSQVAVAEQLEEVALRVLQERHPERVLATNVEYYSAIVLDVAEIPPPLAPAMFACSRVAGWSAHILEQKRTGRLFRPLARYVGPAPRSLQPV